MVKRSGLKQLCLKRLGWKHLASIFQLLMRAAFTLIIVIGLFSCASNESIHDAISDRGCHGEVQRDYSVEWDSETGEVSQNQSETCRADEPEPYGGQKLPTEKDLERMRKEQKQ